MTESPRCPADLPAHDVMLDAFLRGDPEFDGIFLTGVRTTGIFCQPSCPARKPLPRNVEFFANARDALYSGYRPCKRCRPLEDPDQTPDWVTDLLARVGAEPGRRWRDQDLRQLGLSPSRVRRWFTRHHGMTFHAYARGLRVGRALGSISRGGTVTRAAVDHGYDSLSGFDAAIRRISGAAPGTAAEPIAYQRLDTPLGPMIAGAVDEGLCLLEFADRRALEKQLTGLARRLGRPLAPGPHRWLDRADEVMCAYFGGETELPELPLVADGTPFQERVWTALRAIPRGTTVSYAELATGLGQPNAVRAVGLANGANRIAILIPCHRVIGADGRLTGYGGGVWRKRKLLALEGVEIAD